MQSIGKKDLKDLTELETEENVWKTKMHIIGKKDITELE